MVINILPESKNDPKIYEMSNGIIYSRKPGSTERIIEGYLKNDISYSLHLWISLYNDARYDPRLAEEVDKLLNYYILCKK